ncbi:MAG: RIP metalloprotease RseP [Bacillota bacterium]|nr:RIP metalloprotease RseP [Bacillota bacterium]
MPILISVLVLGFLICIHELGHFLVAKLVDIQVEEFSIGFGPKLFSFQPVAGQTRYSFRCLPLGGFVKMAGMDPTSDHVKGFNKKPLRDRLAVISAGSIANFLIGIILFIFTFSVIGIPTPSNSNIIGEVIPGSPAAQVGLKPGDKIIQVNDAATKTWEEIALNIHKRAQQETRLVIERNEKKYPVFVTPQFEPRLQVGQIGIRPSLIWEKQNFSNAVRLGLNRAFTFAHLILQGLFGTVIGAVPPEEIAGPVGITQMIGEAAQGGLGYLLSFTAILGINLALVNLLPIPALDGSRLVFLLLEGIRGKPVDPEKENFIHLIGFALLMVLILLITYNDLARLLTGQ